MILGIDPGFDRLGYAFISSTDEPRVIDLGIISSRKENTYFQRLAEIQSNIRELIERHQPTLSGIEKLFFAKNVKTAINVAQARGVILAELVNHRVEIRELAPSEIKKAMTGNGSASKEQVGEMVQRLLGLSEAVKQDDASDALAIALTVWQQRDSSHNQLG